MADEIVDPHQVALIDAGFSQKIVDQFGPLGFLVLGDFAAQTVRDLAKKEINARTIRFIRRRLMAHGLGLFGEEILPRSDMVHGENGELRAFTKNGEFLAGLASQDPKKARRALEQLVAANQPFVLSIVKQWAWACSEDSRERDVMVDFEDLVQAGNEGLLKAIQRFEPSRGFTLTSYAKWWIELHIRLLVSSRGQILLPTGITVEMQKYKKVSRQTLIKEGQDEEELLREKMGLSLFKFKLILHANQIRAARYVSLDAPQEDDEGSAYSIQKNQLLEQAALVHIGGFYERLDEKIMRLSLKARCAWIIESELLSPKQRTIMIKRFGLDGTEVQTLEQVAEIFGITRERVRQIEVQVLRLLGSVYLWQGYEDIILGELGSAVTPETKSLFERPAEVRSQLVQRK